MKVGTKLRKLRKKKGMTLLQMSECVGKSSNQLSKYENNRVIPKQKIIDKMMNALSGTLDKETNPLSYKLKGDMKMSNELLVADISLETKVIYGLVPIATYTDGELKEIKK